MSSNNSGNNGPSRRQLLKGLGVVGVGTATANFLGGGALLHSIFADDTDEERVEQIANESAEKKANETAEDTVERELSSYKLQGIESELFQDAYSEVSDENEDMADRIIPGRVYDDWTDGDVETGELLEVDFLYGDNDAVDSKIRFLREFEDEGEDWSGIYDVDDVAAEALYENLQSQYDGDNELIDEYGVEEWLEE